MRSHRAVQLVGYYCHRIEGGSNNLITQTNHKLLSRRNFTQTSIYHLNERKERNDTIAGKNKNDNASDGIKVGVGVGGKRGPTLLNLIQTFPSGVKKLYNDHQRFQNINDASNTKINAWSNLPQVKVHTINIMNSIIIRKQSNNTNDNNNISIVRAPRRQQEQQKRFLRDIRKVILPVTIASLPFVGNAIFLFVVIRPYVFLSDQFFTREQVRHFVSIGYYQRTTYFDASAVDLCKMLNLNNLHDCDYALKDEMKVTKRKNEIQSMEDSVIPLYIKFQKVFGNHNELFQNFSRRQIMNITHSSWLASPTLFLQPLPLIRYRLNIVIQDILQDDINLIREGQHEQNCSSLTCDEIFDACSLRSLPCCEDHSSDGSNSSSQTIDSMRRNLTEHLRIMNQVMIHVGGEEEFKRSTATAYLLLYLPVVRQQFMSNI